MTLDFELDERCGEHFTYRDLIECGETWHRLTREAGAPLDNMPRERQTLAAICATCWMLLDPLMERFGKIELTYGFASPALIRHISGHIAPSKDQHASWEKKANGEQLCIRNGFAVDFFVPGLDTFDVAKWVVANNRFDRLYFYGRDRPLHVSIGPEWKREIVLMQPGPSGRLLPKRVSPEQFLSKVNPPKRPLR